MVKSFLCVETFWLVFTHSKNIGFYRLILGKKSWHVLLMSHTGYAISRICRCDSLRHRPAADGVDMTYVSCFLGRSE